MRRSLLGLCSLAVLLLLSVVPAAQPLLAQTAPPASVAPAPEVRVVAPVSNSALTTLKGNVHPLAQARFDQGAVPASNTTGRMLLLLRRSDTQETALHHYMDDLQNPSSPNYRKWLTPDTLGKSYGISDSDLASVKGWLESEGLRVESVPQARNLVVFSGTVGALQTAFHTSIHSFLVNGQKHFANTVDPQIPAALAHVIAGVSPMNDFHAKPLHHLGTPGVYDPESKRIKPNLTLQGCGNSSSPCNDVLNYLFVDPADAATIYNTPNQNLNAHYSAAHSWDGSGITIGIVGYSNLPTADVLNYRTAFLNDADPTHVPTVVVDGNDPGVIQGSTADEALLDTEVSGGIAPGASQIYYTAASTDLADGLSLAILRALDDNNVSILSVSYGNSEYRLGAAGNLQFDAFWEQAAAQGITVTVSTGDSGSAARDDPNSVIVATGGLAVSGIASTPYNIAVGGTDFAVLGANGTNLGQYVNVATNGVSPYFETANGFIPEVAWNDSPVTNGTVAADVAFKDSNGNTNIVAGGGGKSSLAYCNAALNSDGSCPVLLTGYSKPAYQTSITPGDGVRDIPDVSFFASNGQYNAFWAFCSDNVTDGDTTQTYTHCQTTGGQFTSASTFGSIGGTSAAAPAFAGMLALVAQSLGSIRLGQANNVLYNLAANHYSTVFHDTTAGNNSVPCTAGTPNCGSNGFLTGYDTGTGYDYATGLGSVNATQLVSLWSSAAFTPTVTTLGVRDTANGAYSTAPLMGITHGTSLGFQVTVSPSSATGDVSVTNTSNLANNQASYQDGARPLTGGVSQFSSNDLPGGSYGITAYYYGDATHAPSSSPAPPISVNIGAESSALLLAINIVNPSTNATVNAATIPYGYYAYAEAEPYGSLQVVGNTLNTDGVPTGSINLSVNGVGMVVPLNSIGIAEYPIYNQAPGTYSFAATYAGDASYSASASPTQTLTITKGTTTLQLSSTKNTTAVAALRKPGVAGRLNRQTALGGGVVLCSLVLLFGPRAWRTRRQLTGLLLLIVVAGGIGCGSSSSNSGGSSSPAPTPASGTYTVTATVDTDSVGASPTGTVTIAVGGTTYNAVTTQTGTAQDGTSATQVTFTVPGTAINVGANTVSATYAGDTNYNGVTATGTITGS